MRAARLLPPLLGLAWMGGYRFVTGATPSFPAVEASGWLFWLAAILGLGGVCLGPLPPLRRAALAVFGGASALGLLLHAKIEYAWTEGQASLWIAGLSTGLGAFSLLGSALETLPPRPALTGLLASFGAAAFALASTGSLLLGGLEAVVALEVAALLLLSLRWPSPVWTRGAVLIGGPLHVGLLLLGLFYSSLPGPSALPLACAPAGLLLARSGRTGLGLLATLGLAGAAVAVGLALAGLPEGARAFLPI